MTVDTYHYSDQPQLYCPACQHDLSVTKHERGDTRPPQHGDHAVCAYCFTFLRYVAPEPGALRLDVIPREEFEALPEQLQAALMQARGELQAAGEDAKPTRYETLLALELTALKQRFADLACSCLACSRADTYNCMRRGRRA